MKLGLQEHKGYKVSKLTKDKLGITFLDGNRCEGRIAYVLIDESKVN